MGDTLLESWLDGHPAIDVRDDASLHAVVEAIRSRGTEVGLPPHSIDAATTAAAELVHDQLQSAHEGRIAVARVERGGVLGVEIIAADRSEGVATATTMAMYDLVHEADVDLRYGEGRCVRARMFATPLPRSEVAVVAQAGDADPVCGDHAAIERYGTRLRVAICDGLGRGPLARDAANRAVDAILDNRDESLPMVIERCDDATTSSRGVELGIAEVDLSSHRLVHASIGTVSARVFRADGNGYLMRAFAGVLGAHALARAVPIETVVFEPGDVAVLATDGLASPLAIGHNLGREPALAIALDLMSQYGRAGDDTLVAVIR